MGEKVTRNDVAKRAGVSPAVVSYVINGSNYVSEEKRRLVEEAVRELHYTPNIFAKSLRTGKPHQVALVGDSLESGLFRGLSEKLYECGLYASLYYSVVEDSFVDHLIAMNYDAVFMTSNRFSTAQLNRIAGSGIPIVLFRSRDYGTLDKRIVVLAPDIFGSIRKSVDYLTLRGHSRFALIPPLKYRTEGLGGDDYRSRAFRAALQAHDIPVGSAFYATHTQSAESLLNDVFDMMTGTEPDRRPTAFIVGEDDIAARLIQYLCRLGLRVPQDAAVVGWGDSPICGLVSPQLTTIGYDRSVYIEKVTEAILALTGEKEIGPELVPATLVIRESA